MKQTTTYYDLLEISPDADLAEISAAYLRIWRELSSGNSLQGQTEAEFRLKLVKHAYEVLSQPSRRADYDAGLALRHGRSPVPDIPLHVEVALETKKWSPIRRLLTVIASLMVLGMVMQISAMFMTYQRTKAVIGGDISSPAAEKVYLQDFYQTYGIRAASRAEAELLLAEMRRKEEAEREERNKAQLSAEQERKQRRFEEESRRIGEEASANVRRAEQEAARAKEEEARQKEEKAEAERAAERARIENEINRFRSRPGQYAE